jgi:hypothetical protein
MTSTWELFSSLNKQDLRVQVELGDDVKYIVVGVGTIPFLPYLVNSLGFENVLVVPGLGKNFLSI